MTKARTLADNFAADINGITASAPLTGGGTSGTVTVGIQAGTTAQSGAVQLTDSTASTSTTTAATPNSVKSAYDLANGAIAKSTVDAKGDLLVGTANDTIGRLAVASTAGYLLTVDSAEATGLKWTAPAGGDFVKLVASSFSAVSSHSVNDVFSATYKFYKVYLEFDSSSGSPEVSMRLRVSGTDATTNYNSSRIYFYGPSVIGVDNNAGLGTDEIAIGATVTGFATQSSSEILIGTPFDATATNFQYHAQVFNGSSYINLFGGGSHSTATSYTGFTLIASTGTFNGTVYVYGLRA